MGTKRPLWQVVALKTQEWNRKHGNVGLVMGATYPEQLKEARKLCPDMPILVPGIGAQEGALRDSVQAGLNSDRAGVIISALALRALRLARQRLCPGGALGDGAAAGAHQPLSRRAPSAGRSDGELAPPDNSSED